MGSNRLVVQLSPAKILPFDDGFKLSLERFAMVLRLSWLNWFMKLSSLSELAGWLDRTAMIYCACLLFKTGSLELVSWSGGLVEIGF